MKPFIKICGLTRPGDIRAVVAAGADAVGFVLAESSSRRVTIAQLRDLAALVPAGVLRVGVFAGQSRDFLLAAVAAGKLDAVQLHGTEPSEFAAAIDFAAVWKAVHLAEAADLDRFDGYPAVRFVIDAARGGSGRTCDWRLARQFALRHPVLIAGGISPDNAVRALAETAARGVDLSSSLESAPGCKDPGLVQKLFNNLEGVVL